MVDSYITDEMRAQVGKERDRRVSFPVDKSAIRQWAIAVRWPEPPERLYWDEEYAEKTRFGGIIAPPFFNPFAYHVDEERMQAGEGWGRSARIGPFAVAGGAEGTASFAPGTRPLNGGGEAEYYEPIRPGDVVTSVTKVAEIYEREGRLGLMLFTITETTWTNQKGQLVRIYRGTSIRY